MRFPGLTLSLILSFTLSRGKPVFDQVHHQVNDPVVEIPPQGA
jgi:hypothetical protein